jgi:hypothetical protein
MSFGTKSGKTGGPKPKTGSKKVKSRLAVGGAKKITGVVRKKGSNRDF